MGLDLPAQNSIDRRIPDEPFLIRIDTPEGPIFEEAGGSYSDHHPGDPSRFRRPESAGWSCPPFGGGCVWLGLP
ncbi:hypothetical protein FPZ12_037540 [Amycolatopsis acidicola]|uniref:Uncharacterized protein n=1 Tax=Amycolatopsis acidicola TaxID=2596893 RepID=A0A5N0URP6_9PSEU|nr:hypothetical protein [Amycolatopsis acidicola]KAA9152091.1 hypothetical protein FPZ12_037540 [Amycolatopsis acidicola]